VTTLKPVDCPKVTTDKIRYADTDRQGHVNNAAFAAFFETGRVEILYNPSDPLMADDCEFVIVSLDIQFKGEIRWPGEVVIGTYLRKLGQSSIHFGQVLYQDERCVAEAETVVVQIDQSSREAARLSDRAKERLGALILDVHAS
jgi:acyl-CoA thioester hydrolase